MWGKISKVPLPDFEPPRGIPQEGSLRGNPPEGNPLENPLKETLERNPPRGISLNRKSLEGHFTTRLIFTKTLTKPVLQGLLTKPS